MTITEVFERLRRFDDDRRTRYGELIRTLTADGGLEDGDVGRLDDLRLRLGLSVADLQRDTSLLSTYNQTKAHVDELRQEQPAQAAKKAEAERQLAKEAAEGRRETAECRRYRGERAAAIGRTADFDAAVGELSRARQAVEHLLAAE